MSTSAISMTLPQVEKEILGYRGLIASFPRPDPHRPACLMRLAKLLGTIRQELSPHKDNRDKSIIHLTEAVLLSFQPNKNVVYRFFQLANALLGRFIEYGQPEDVKSSLKYFRFLRITFRPIEAFDIPHDTLTSLMIGSLVGHSELRSGDTTTQDLEEMVTLTHELISGCSGSTSNLRLVTKAVEVFSLAITRLYSDGRNQPPEKVIQVLREAVVLVPHSLVHYALASCLAARFQSAHVIKDYEEAIALTNKSWLHTPLKIASLLNTYPSPENLEVAIHHFRTLLRLPSLVSLPDQEHTELTFTLDNLVRRRFAYFGDTGNSGEVPSDTSYLAYFHFEKPAQRLWGGGPEDDPGSQIKEKMGGLMEIHSRILNGQITNIRVAVERSRAFLPSPSLRSSHRLSCLPAIEFANILFEAHQRTNSSDYLDEAITTCRDLCRVSAPKLIHFQARERLLQSLNTRWILLHFWPDFDECMQLFPEVVNDGCREVFYRFKMSCWWASSARPFAHRSTSAAYETAMSLMQETLVFSPTLQYQHSRLAYVLTREGGLASDYVSYRLETGHPEQAIETLERGRALIWSEMRGLRTSTDQLRAAHPALADKLVDINGRLESVTMSVAQSDAEEMGDTETGSERHEGMESIGRSVTTQRRLLKERGDLISHIQSFPGFENFLKPPSFDLLNSAAAQGPVIIINQSKFRSHTILLLKNSPPSVISTPSDFHDRANRLKDDLLRVRNDKEKGLDSKDYDLTLASVLADLYELVVKPVIWRLRRLKVPEKSRVWWCPTASFCSLPLHAMGPIPSDDCDKVYFMDLYITSYTPTLSALIESRKPDSQTPLDKPSLLLVAQPETLNGAWGEIDVVEAVGTPVTTLVSNKATPTTVVANLKDHRFVHFVCHGLLQAGRPFDASFELHGGNLTLLEIVRSRHPAAEFAFLSACHTAELTEDSIADEGLHLEAAMQFCGFRGVVGTLWAMADTDGPDLSRLFYKAISSESTSRRGVPYYEKSARALQSAVKKLRKKRGVSLERWVNFVHYGA